MYLCGNCLEAKCGFLIYSYSVAAAARLFSSAMLKHMKKCPVYKTSIQQAFFPSGYVSMWTRGWKRSYASEELYDITDKTICKSDCHNLKVRDYDESKPIRK